MSAPAKISDSEWEIMNIVWARSPVASSEIVDELHAKRGWASRTTRTLLDRLVKKKALVINQDGKRYLYRPKVAMDACVRDESRSFLDRVFGGEPGAMLAHFVKNADLTPEDIAELKRILNEKEK